VVGQGSGVPVDQTSIARDYRYVIGNNRTWRGFRF
jgi:hypothetical protein